MSQPLERLLYRPRRAFYRWGGAWYRNRLFEALGSQRYSYPALHEMDRKLERYVDFDGGVFVEAGAHDGYTQSNTYHLERFRGWTGVLVEASPQQAARCRARRPRSRVAQCALVAADFPDDEITLEVGDLMSTVRGAGVSADDEQRHASIGAGVAGRRQHTARVPARTLDAVLDDAGVDHVDLVSLDVEGYELSVLRGIDLSRRRPTFLLIEMLDVEASQPEFDAFLDPWYEPIDQLSVCDVLYRAREATT